jgi:hypothetical protein
LRWEKAHHHKTPEVVFSLLHKLIEKKVFTDRLSREIAQRIMTAVMHFNPTLIQDNSPERKIVAPHCAKKWPLKEMRQ